MYKTIYPPLPDECLRGYGLRLASANGEKSFRLDQTLTTLTLSTGIDIGTLVKHHSHCGYTRFVHGIYFHKSIDTHKDLTWNARISSGSVPTEFPQLCPLCVEEDLAFHGISYWRRAHHLPGIDHCLKHLIPLVEANSLDMNRNQPANANRVCTALTECNFDTYFESPDIKNFVALSDSALHTTTSLKPSDISSAISKRAHKLYEKKRISISQLARQKFPEFWLRRHFPLIFGQHSKSRGFSTYEVLRTSRNAYMTKSYLLALALLWEEPDQAIRDCQFESFRVPNRFDEIGANKVLSDVLAGRTITASCRRHKVRMRDFEFVLQNFLKNPHDYKFLD
jgi:TniQ